ncbi:hypothetical protein C8Q76DRAFT_634760 [Earliella scabrosa]|nr:hypothetical protein C8Q76DRAFT_634760 [Earliella scabrosa]
MSTTIHRKRFREELDDSRTLRDAELWYDDGTVILVARGVEFRLYKGILAEHSLVFQDMFSTQQPRSSSPLQDSTCPVIHLSDSPESLRHFFRALLPGNEYRCVCGSRRPSLHVISALIHLGDKYRVPHLVHDALDHLKALYPATLSAWDQERRARTVYDRLNLHEAIEVINLARFTDEPALLPTAFLSCCYAKGSIVQGFEYEDGSVTCLQPQDVARCLNAGPQLCTAALAIAARVLSFPIADRCESRRACREEAQAMLQLLLFNAHAGDLAESDPFRKFVEKIEEGHWHFCAPCLEAIQTRDRDERRALWRRLPEIFDLAVEGWGD